MLRPCLTRPAVAHLILVHVGANSWIANRFLVGHVRITVGGAAFDELFVGFSCSQYIIYAASLVSIELP